MARLNIVLYQQGKFLSNQNLKQNKHFQIHHFLLSNFKFDLLICNCIHCAVDLTGGRTVDMQLALVYFLIAKSYVIIEEEYLTATM